MAAVPTDLTVEEELPIAEKNGFVIADLTPDKIVIRFYAWKPPDPPEAIDSLEPVHVLELSVPG